MRDFSEHYKENKAKTDEWLNANAPDFVVMVLDEHTEVLKARMDYLIGVNNQLVINSLAEIEENEKNVKESSGKSVYWVILIVMLIVVFTVIGIVFLL